jgi:hypothetical protein
MPQTSRRPLLYETCPAINAFLKSTLSLRVRTGIRPSLQMQCKKEFYKRALIAPPHSYSFAFFAHLAKCEPNKICTLQDQQTTRDQPSSRINLRTSSLSYRHLSIHINNNTISPPPPPPPPSANTKTPADIKLPNQIDFRTVFKTIQPSSKVFSSHPVDQQ